MGTVAYKNIHKRFGDTIILDDINLHIKEKQFVVLLGSSGCGKTTLLRMTAGLEDITKGHIEINSQIVNNVHPRDRGIAMVFQSYALYPQMNVYDNIAFALQTKKMDKNIIDQKVKWAADTLNITNELRKYPKELSGGQKQRVAMGRAMVMDSSIFLFDEPLSNLDAKLRAHMRYEIRKLHERLRATTIYVTHDQIEAMTMADIIVVMNKGKIEQADTPDIIYNKPQSKYVADFVGSPSMNFIDGEIITNGQDYIFCAQKLKIKIPKLHNIKSNQLATLGIRPSNIAFAKTSGNINTKAKIIFIETTGHEHNLRLNVEGIEILASTTNKGTMKVGDSCYISFDMDNINLFDAKTGQRID